MSNLPDLLILTAAVEALEASTEIFDDGLQASAEEMTDWLDSLRKLLGRVRTCDATVQQRLGALMRDVPLVFGEHASAEAKYGSTKRRWQHGAMKSIAAEKVVGSHVDLETGAFDGTPMAVMLAEVLEWPSISGWKSTVARKYGVNVTNYCEADQGRYSVIVRSNGSSAEEDEDDDD